jgi:hypothetical protein
MVTQPRRIADRFWERHSNPWTGWSRVSALPLLGAAVAAHSGLAILLVVLWLAVNPLLFPPRHERAWMTRGVLGERPYYASSPRLRRDLPTLLNLASAPAFGAFLWFAWHRDAAAAVSTGLLVAVLKFWFLDRMVALYNASSASQSSDQAG